LGHQLLEQGLTPRIRNIRYQLFSKKLHASSSHSSSSSSSSSHSSSSSTSFHLLYRHSALGHFTQTPEGFFKFFYALVKEINSQKGMRNVLGSLFYDFCLQPDFWLVSFHRHVCPAEIRRIMCCAYPAEHVHRNQTHRATVHPSIHKSN